MTFKKGPLPTPEQEAELMRELDQLDHQIEAEEAEEAQLRQVAETAFSKVPPAQALPRLAQSASKTGSLQSAQRMLLQMAEELRAEAVTPHLIGDLAATAWDIAKKTDNPQERELCQTLEAALTVIEESQTTSSETLRAVIIPLNELFALPMYQTQPPAPTP